MKTAIVTGGAGGIGAAVVKKLCREGYSTAIVYFSAEEKALALSSALISAGYDAFPIRADVRDPQEANDTLQRIWKLNGRVDVLVNNAGIAMQQLFQDTTDESWANMIGTNLNGVFHVSRAALPYMLQRNYGRIINISSMWGQVGASMETAYSAAKAGVIGLTKALAKETALSGITVNCVAPGAIDTDMMAGFSEADVAALCEEIPMGRLGSPEDVAEAVAFFAAETSGYITGQILGVNGGFVT